MSSATNDPGMRLRWRVSIGALALILLVAAWVLGGRTFAVVAGETRRAEVDRAFSKVPLLLGAWLGTDVPLPAGATEVLHATGTLSRRYVRIGSSTEVTVALVHCGDVRDMLGHYPPACYPSQGWQLTNAGGDLMPIRLLGRPATAAVYRFEKPESGGSKSSLSVVGCFLLPGKPSTSDVST
ncbi:MAG: exosortase-associated EpsI family protein, partial [Phycisphaerales bacterium]